MISKNRVAMLAAALLLPLIALGTWYLYFYKFNGKPGPSGGISQLTKMHYLEPSPPSRLYGPGTINMVEEGPNGEIFLHRACNVPEAVLKVMWVESPTADINSATRAQHEFIASTEAGIATSDIAADRLVSTSVSLRDTRVITMSLEDLFKVREEYLKGTCEKMIIHNIKAGKGKVRVCQTREVLQADLVYDLTYENGLDSAQKAEVTKQIAAESNLTADTSQVDGLRGEDLFYGVRLEQQCIVFDGPV